MDPNATLKELRHLLGSEISEPDVHDVADLFAALDGWLSKGGFPPSAWTQTR